MKKLFLLLIGIFFALNCYSQVKVIHFNATWNSTNRVTWVKNLNDCSVKYIDVAKNPTYQKKYSLVVFPTIIIFNNGEEVKRYQADLSFKVGATKSEVQEEIDNLIMSDF